MSVSLEASFSRCVVNVISLNSETCRLLWSVYETEEADKHKKSSELHVRLWSVNDGDGDSAEEGTGFGSGKCTVLEQN